MKWNDRLYFGTWQLSGQFKDLTNTQIENLIQVALTHGIYKFDTASVYGQGNIEKILGACLPQEARVLTKIPAILKPDAQTPVDKCYSCDSIHRGAEQSLSRLGRDFIDILLLHNWMPLWQKNATYILETLKELKRIGIARQVGISLPNGFSHYIDDSVLEYIDVIEAPYNIHEQWIVSQLSQFKRLGKEVLLRSLFLQGKILIGGGRQAGISAMEILTRTLKLETSVVIGMTTTDQIIQNINHLKGASP